MFDLVEEGIVVVVEKFHVGRSIGRFDDCCGKFGHAVSAFGKALCLCNAHCASCDRRLPCDSDLFGRVVGEPVDCHYGWKPVHANDIQCVLEVSGPPADSFRIWRRHVFHSNAAVPLEPANRCDHHCGRRFGPALPDLDIHELFETEVGTEPGFGNDIVAAVDCQFVGKDRRAAVCDVAERAHVNDGRLAFGGLHQVRLDGISEQSHDRADPPDFAGGNRRFTIFFPAHNNVAYSFAQVLVRVGQGADCHDL